VLSDAILERAAAPCRKRLQSCQRTSGYARIVGWPATPSRFVSDRCSPRVMRRGIFSFPSRRSATRGPNLRSLAGRGEASDLALRPAALMGFSDSLRRFDPAAGETRVSAYSGPTCRSSISGFPIIFIGRFVLTVCVLVWSAAIESEMDSTSGLRLPSAVHAGRLTVRHDPALGFFLLQVCGRPDETSPLTHRCGLDTATITGP